jgi:hypothetical protein
MSDCCTMMPSLRLDAFYHIPPDCCNISTLCVPAQ